MRGHGRVFHAGTFAGRDLPYGWAFVGFIAAFACLIAMNFTVRQSAAVSAGLLFAVGLLLGLAMSPTLVYYAGVNPQALWQAGGATALFIAGCGAGRNATRRDLSGVARAGFWALLALIMGRPDDLRQHPRRRAGLLDSRAGDLRGPDHVRFPAALIATATTAGTGTTFATITPTARNPIRRFG